MDIRKKPYEISLWDEQLVWFRRKLIQVEVTENTYKRGTYYVKTDATYELSYDNFAGGPYFQFANLPEDGKNQDGIFIESDKPEGVKVEEGSGWYENGDMVPNIISSYYKETRLCTIGSSTMDSLARCVNPKLVSKVNGENIFTFTMYYQYIDPETGEKVYNPFIPYMTNERKVKLNLDGVWYDFVIKQIQENSETRAFTYTCKDQFVNELSKTGFELVLDNELENNMGTVVQLAETILEGSDWALDEEETDNLKQFIEEPLYRIKLGTAITADDMNTEAAEEIQIDADEYIYVFYSQINDQKSELQFLYNENQPFETNDKLVIDKDKYPNYIIKDVKFITDNNGNKWPDFTKPLENGLYNAVITSDYRGMRLVRQIQTKYDSTIDKFVQVYKKDGQTYYGFSQSKYLSPNAVNDYVVNGSAFTNTTGWYTEKGTDGSMSTLEIKTNPEVGTYIKVDNPTQEEYSLYRVKEGDNYVVPKEEFSAEETYYINSIYRPDNFTSYLYFPNNNEAKLMNSSINSHKSGLGELIKDKTEYILRIKYKVGRADREDLSTVLPTAYIAKYERDENDKFQTKLETKDAQKVSDKTYYIYDEDSNTYVKFNGTKFVEGTKYYEDWLLFEFKEPEVEISKTNEEKQDTNFIYMKATCSRSVSQTELKDWDNKFGLFLEFGEGEIFIENIQLFPYLTIKNEQEETILCVPGGELFAETKTIWKYYVPNKEYTSIEDVQFVHEYEAENGDPDYILQYNEGADAYTKVTSITAKESNRFNLLQDLNEKFECWARFKIEHNQDGSIKLGKDEGILTGDEAYRQQKFVSFHEYTGDNNYVGFRYGVNSKSIQRTLDSNAIASKLIVKNNANEFAPNGFCSIARAKENPTGENFLLNFDHYIRQKLLDIGTVTNDLYVNANGYLGYYAKLKQINKGREAKIDEQTSLANDIMKYQASHQTYKLSYDAAVEERLVIEEDMRKLVGAESGTSFEEVLNKGEAEGWSERDKFESYKVKWAQCKNVEAQHGPLYKKAEEYLEGAKAKYDSITEDLEEMADKKRALNLQFYKKYSRFIQEGSWIKEDYVDDNLYYLDSVSTLNTSAQPKVTYNISVVEISQLPGYESYTFKLGDKTYIEDIEFFGYSLIDRKTPYREEIVVSEITQELDSPEKNQIKVQNYKTQFQDLFQRIAAQTQQAEYHTGEYRRAANVVETDGTISLTTLENSFANNQLRLQNARDQSVVIDEYGITSTSLANPSEMVRIVAGGIFMSTDGGSTWKTGLTGHGLNSSYLTAGQINVDELYIMSDSQPAFGWDEKGISAYSKYGTGYNTNRFTRFDQFGLYGVSSERGDWAATSLNEVENNADFGLTWEGFFLKNSDGSVKISSKNDIQVLKEGTERIKIGRLNTSDDPLYGIRISDNNGNAVMETGSDGNLWLKRELSVGNQGTAQAFIGYKKEENEPHGSILRAGTGDNQFIVYEDGSIRVTGATISGRIEAEEGYIGGLQLENGILQSTNVVDGVTEDTALTINTNSGAIVARQISIGGLVMEDGILKTQVTTEEPVPSLTINTNTGEISAKNITLGEGATISNYLNLGERAKLLSPGDDGIIFQVAERDASSNYLTITQTGVLTIGDIALDGQNSKIYSESNFSITPQVATFNNINCSGTIETVVFKKGTVQSAAGAMIFSPSYRISSAILRNDKQYVDIIIDDPPEEASLTGHIVWLSTAQENLKARVTSHSDKQVTVKLALTRENAFSTNQGTLVDLGQQDNCVIMGVNSGNAEVYEILKPRGFTVYGPSQEGDSELRAFLGDLTSLGKNGYGLYADNVYLNGSLTTKSSTGKIAGVNTISNVLGDKDLIGSDSPIIFWAGSDSDSKEDIQQAPFQVTEDGYVYANQVILAGRIEAAAIYDAEKGISFKRKKKEGEEEDPTVFSIRTDGFVRADGIEYFIKPNEVGNVNFIGDLISGLGEITSANNALLIKIDGQERAFFEKEETKLIKTVKYVTDDVIMEYRGGDAGYDLYITASATTGVEGGEEINEQ